MSYKYFKNEKCEYFPCHKDVKDFNCKFCFCPLYLVENCEGNYIMLKNGIKDCTYCTIIHEKDFGYDFVLRKLNEEFLKKKK